MQKSIYKWEIYNGAGFGDSNRVADISLIARQRHFTIQRNRAEVMECVMSLGEVTDLCNSLGLTFSQLFAPGVNSLRITRGSRALVAGQINYVRPELEGDAPTVTLRATGWLDLFKDVMVYNHLGDPPIQFGLQYFGITIGQAAQHLIDEAQARTNGDRGITIGTIQTSRSSDFNFQALGRTIKDSLVDLTKLSDSGDFEFTPDKVFNWYDPGIGTDKTELTFRYPGNITKLAMPIDATALVNSSINRGQGNGYAQVIEIRDDTSSQGIYYLRERMDDYPAETLATRLDEKGDETLRLYANPTTIPDVTLDGTQDPPLGAYWIGDRVRFQVDAGPVFGALSDQVWRINEIDVTLDDNDHEAISLAVGYS